MLKYMLHGSHAAAIGEFKHIFMNLSKHLQAYRELSERFPRSQKLYDKGLEIFLLFGPKNNLRTILSKGQSNPRPKHWGHMEHQLKKLGLDTDLTPTPQVAPPDEREKVLSKVPKSAVDITFKAPDILPDDLELLIKQNREIAQKRAMLSNKLKKVEIGGDLQIIEDNKNLVEEIMELVAQQEPIEEKIAKLKITPEKEKPNPENPIIFQDKKHGELRLNDLYAMSIPDLGDLKIRIRSLEANLRHNMKKYTKEATKLRTEKKIIKHEYAITVIERVIADLKLAEL